MTLRWKRQEPGHYVCGTWHVKGVGTNWDLYNGRKHVAHGKSKKECQQLAENPPKQEDDPEPTPADRGTGFKPRGGKASLDDLHGVLTSLYLDMTGLSASVTQLAHYMKEEAEAKDRLTKAVLLLARHVQNLEKK